MKGIRSLVLGTTTVVALLAASPGIVGEDARPRAGDSVPRWTNLPLPPELPSGSTFAWAGTELVLWGGCDPEVEDDCRPSADGYAFDIVTEKWRSLPPAPTAGDYAQEVWTGSSVVFLSERDDSSPVTAQSYTPASGAWTTLPAPPLKSVSDAVWTGTHVLAWSDGSRARPRVWKGAAYDLAAGEWRRLPDAPFALSLYSGVWTGSEVILFGSLLNNRHLAETTTSVGEAYSPLTNTWRRLPPSKLSPQATSAALVGGKLVAWDYETDYQIYDPALDDWTKPRWTPLEFSECYPSSEVARAAMFAFFCGQAALFDPVTREWREARGGPLKERIEGAGHSLDLWRFASMESSGEAIYLLMEGITVSKRDVPCYGCHDSPQSFWAYRPRTGN